MKAKGLFYYAAALAAVTMMPGAAAVQAANSGTALSISVDATAGAVCGEFVISYTVQSTAAADAATITADADTVGLIASGNVMDGGGWMFAGRTKTAVGDFTLTLDPGEYSIDVCATQHGAQGRQSKQACTTVEITADGCSVTLCDPGACISNCQHAGVIEPRCCECVCKSTVTGCTPQAACFTAAGINPPCLLP
jgi:hypothetical protein